MTRRPSSSAKPPFQGQGWYSFQADAAAALLQTDRLTAAADAMSLTEPALLRDRLKDCLSLLPRVELLAEAAFAALSASAALKKRAQAEIATLWRLAQPADSAHSDDMRDRLAGILQGASRLAADLSTAEEAWASSNSPA